jgi:hypothetical protein
MVAALLLSASIGSPRGWASPFREPGGPQKQGKTLGSGQAGEGGE